MTYTPDGGFDIVLMDRTLHMLPEVDRLAVLANLILCVPTGGWVLIADERSNMGGFKDVFAADQGGWTTMLDARRSLFLQRA